MRVSINHSRVVSAEALLLVSLIAENGKHESRLIWPRSVFLRGPREKKANLLLLWINYKSTQKGTLFTAGRLRWRSAEGRGKTKSFHLLIMVFLTLNAHSQRRAGCTRQCPHGRSEIRTFKFGPDTKWRDHKNEGRGRCFFYISINLKSTGAWLRGSSISPMWVSPCSCP